MAWVFGGGDVLGWMLFSWGGPESEVDKCLDALLKGYEFPNISRPVN